MLHVIIRQSKLIYVTAWQRIAQFEYITLYVENSLTHCHLVTSYSLEVVNISVLAS